MTYPSFPVGEVMADDLQELSDGLTDHESRIDSLEGHAITFVRKTATETVNNSAVLQNDDVLALAVAASTVYELELRLSINSGTTPDFKFGWTYPTGLTMSLYTLEPNASGVAAAQISEPFAESAVRAASTFAANQTFLMRGVAVVSSTAGTLQFQWAQNTANASDTNVLANSYLRLTKMA